METHNHNLNIHYSAPQEVWDKLAELYISMPYWYGSIKGIPYWYGQDGDEKTISVSVEPSGLQFFAQLPQDEWESWFTMFKIRASEALGYEIGEPEDGFEFRYYE